MRPEPDSWDVDVSSRISALGFRPEPDTGFYRCGDLALHVGGGWCELWRQVRRSGDPSGADHLGRPGLWRRLDGPPTGNPGAAGSPAANPGATRIVEEVFESPASLLIPARRVDPDDDGSADGGDRIHPESDIDGSGSHGGTHRDGADPLSLWLAWALATKDGEAPDRWRCPPSSEIELWAGSGPPLVRAGAIIRQGMIVSGEHRLALRIPILPRICAPLPEHRAVWLAALLEDAGRRWRMVRIGTPRDAAAPLALAEIDLTGAPAALLPELVRNGVQALRLVVEWLVSPAAFLANGDLPSRALEACLPRG